MATNQEVLLEVHDMVKTFGVTVALNHVDFVVKRGEIRGLIGENGSGKSAVSSIARNSGINVFVNVAICYTVAGALVAVSGLLDSAFAGSMNASMGLTSNGSVMANMFAMMIGCAFLSRYINQAVGVISAAVALRIFGMGLTAFNISDAVSSCINMALFIAFLVWQANSQVLKQRKYDRERIAQAQEMKKARAAAV